MEYATLRKLMLAGATGVVLIATAPAQQADSATTAQSNSPASQPPDDSAPIAGATPLGVTVDEQALITRGWRVSELLHAEVYNGAKQNIGRVDDLVIAPDGTLSIAVIDVGGFLGIGRHRVAIPMRQLTASKPKRLVLTGATKEALMKMPEFYYAS